MSEAFVGFDSAWSGKNGGIAWASFRGSRLQDFGEPKPANFEEAACIIETLRDEHRLRADCAGPADAGSQRNGFEAR